VRAAVRQRIALPVALALSLAAVLVGAAVASPPAVDAEAYYVQNASDGEVLAQLDEGERLPIASITKLMTALVTLEHARPADLVTVSSGAAAVGESTIHLQAGETITVGDLLRAALIQSANDAANALAAHVGGNVSRFVSMMNARARELGLTDTHFVNPDGLDAPGHVSSARDVTKLARIAMRKPFIRDTVRQVETDVAGRHLVTWNDLLSTFPHLIGVKTGHTDGAGWSQVAAVRGGGLTVYATLLGGATRDGRNADLAALLSWGLDQYRTVWVIERGRTYARVQSGYDEPDVRLVAAKPALRVVKNDRRLVERVVAPAEVALPVRQGQRLGEVQVLLGGRVVARSPLVASAAVDRPGPLGRVGFYTGRTFRHLGGLLP